MAQDPLRAGLRDELVTEELDRLLAGVEHATYGADPLAASDAVERLGKHLLRVARRMRTPRDSAAVHAGVEAANRAIDALDDDFAGDRISLPPRLLKGISAAPGLTAGALPPHPTIPLTTSELLVNGAGEPSFGAVLREEIRCAEEVDLICAFVGYTGFQPLKDEFRALLERGGRVRVITSTYLGATSAKALDELVRLGVQVRVNYQGQSTKLHAKAWLFRRPGELDTACVGSSNLSDAALYSGLEWNVRLARADAPGVFGRIQQTFESYWHTPVYEAYTLDDRARLDAALLDAKGYSQRAISRTAQRTIDQLNQRLADAYAEISLQPKPHQRHVLETLEHRRTSFDEHRHLVVAATGTGKTVIAALDYARLCAQAGTRPRLLFIAHREQILEQARTTFRRALRDPGFGELLSGSATPATDHHLFAMVQTLGRRLDAVRSDHYEVVYVDEAHHSTASSWRTVVEHFTPRELVGLTATPERTDGAVVTGLFGGGYTTELRLWEAVDDQLLAPFEYVGVDDGTDLRQLSWRSGDYAIDDLANLYTGDHERVRLIVEALHRWVDVPAQMRALAFCVSIDHARFMTQEFNRLGLQAEHLDGDHDQAHRDAVLARLQAGDLTVVFSVDVLGEGIDVPDVDTLLLLRPTQSPVLFAQQLGRGLRLSPGKSSCLVLDFIGQHHAEYRFEERFRALTSPLRGTLREQAEQDFPFLPAGSSITLERVARERVLARLKEVTPRAGLTGLKKDLTRTRSRTLTDFLEETERSVAQFYAVDQRKMSWTRLRREVGGSDVPVEPADPEQRREEAELLRRIGFLQHVSDPTRVDTWTAWLDADLPPDASSLTTFETRLAMQLMHLLGATPASTQEGFAQLWRHPAVRDEICELLSLTRAGQDAMVSTVAGLGDVPLMVHARYTRAEIFAAMGISTIDRPKEHREGVYFAADLRTQLMFVTLNKDEASFASHIQYKDHALSADLFHWETPNNWRQTTPSMLKCVGVGPGASEHRLLFVRERTQGGIEGTFRFFGEVDQDGELEGDRPVAVTWRLRQPLPEVVFEATSLVATG
jgi:superfamily II DNA or RNA helicase/HKD family nuclease